MFNFNRKEKGQGLVEYALILVLIAIVVIGAMTLLGTKVSNTFGTVNAKLAGEGGDGDEEEAAPVSGCTDPLASNYDSSATVDDGSCTPTENLSFEHTWPASCSAANKPACWSGTSVSGCIPGDTYSFAYNASTTWSSGEGGVNGVGSTGSGTATCSGGGSVYLGNFRPGQLVSIKNNVTLVTATSTLPMPY